MKYLNDVKQACLSSMKIITPVIADDDEDVSAIVSFIGWKFERGLFVICVSKLVSDDICRKLLQKKTRNLKWVNYCLREDTHHLSWFGK